MKKFILGVITGSIITGVIFLMIRKNETDEQQENIKSLLELVRKGQATENQAREILNDPGSLQIIHTSLSVIVGDDNNYFYYKGNDCSKLAKAGYDELVDLLKNEKARAGENKFMVIIKTTKGATQRNSLDLLDAIDKAGIAPGHFAEAGMSEKENYCLQQYKKR